MGVLILKLGGSAITDKSKKCTPNIPVIQNAIDQIAEFRGPLVLLHGGGSFAHPFVKQASLQRGLSKPSQLRAISETELFLDQLTRIVATALLLRGKAFVPIRPMSFVALSNGRITNWFPTPIRQALNLGLLPLIHGDLAFDKRLGVNVLSADRLASFLARRLHSSRVLFGCDVDGVFSSNPKDSPRAELVELVSEQNYKSVLRALRVTGNSDATGGMLGKTVEAIQLARTGVECSIFSISRGQRLREALRGLPHRGTKFVPWKSRS